MASSRKNRAASPRGKSGIGAARAVSQARSLPNEVANSEVSGPEVSDSEVSGPEVSGPEVSSSEVFSLETSSPEASVDVPIVTSSEEVIVASEIVDALETPALDSEPIEPVNTPEDILEAVVLEAVVALESVAVEPEPVETKPVETKPVETESAKTLAKTATTPRNKSKVSTQKTVQRSKGDKIMTQETEKSAPLAPKKETALTTTGSALPLRPVAPAELEVVGMISSAGDRPIGATTLAVFGTYLNGRPIEASSMKLFEILPGDRPIFSTEIAYVPGTPVGGRPIMVSPGGLMGAEEVMGNRPIFSNDIVDPDSASLMGYLD